MHGPRGLPRTLSAGVPLRRPPVVLGLALIIGIALCVALGLILFSVNPGVSNNNKEIKEAVSSQHAIICAQVQNTANSYRFRSLTPSGEVEPIRHFLTRMQAQQQTLRLARGSECKSAPNFPPVGLQVRRALHQINEILQHFEPKLRRPVDRPTASVDKQPGFPQDISRPSHAGIDESGVPATLKPKLAPSAPTGPHGGSPAKPKEPQELPPTPETIPVPAEPAPSPEPEVAQEEEGEGGTRVVVKERRELPSVPLPPIEVKVELP